MPPKITRRAFCLTALLLALLFFWPRYAAPAQAQTNPEAEPIISTGEPVTPAVFDGDVRFLPEVPAKPFVQRPLLRAPQEILREQNPTGEAPTGPDVEAAAAPNAMPAPIANFEGIAMSDTCTGGTCGGGWPPDTNGDVGPNHYVQAVNVAVGIFDKSGTRLAAFTFDSLWSGANTGTACDNSNQGDPVVLYDPMGDRWLLADFGFTGDGTTPPFYECIAVSQTGDPVSGGWYLYAIRADDAAHPYFNDYPKIGVWPDGFYMTANEFTGAGSFAGVRIWALNRAQMEAGQAASLFIVDLGNTYYSLLPSNLRGALPPVGTPNYLVTAYDNNPGTVDVFRFKVDWLNPANTLWSGPTAVSVANYTVPSNASVPQPETTTKVDTLGDRLMMQAQYRNIGGTESLWIVHTVKTSTLSTAPTRLQWAQLNVTGGTVATSPVQQQIFGDATYYRWMPSLAVDHAGNMAVGYSRGNGNAPNYPSLYYSGRLSTDNLGTLGQGEASLFAGTASQIVSCGGSACTRWGDYSAMTVDPTDDCTFWYTNEYYASGDTAHWRTRIGSFKFPSCTASPVQPVGTWDGGGADNNWGTAANWTADRVPAVYDNVYFNSASAKNATINGSFNANNVTITSDYTGVITQGTGTVNLQGAYSQAGGTFAGGSGAMTVPTGFTLSGGVFTAPSSTLSVGGDFSNSASFNHNDGVVAFNGATAISGSSTTAFNNLTINSGAALTAPATNMNVAGNWANNGGTFDPNGGTVTFNGAAQNLSTGDTPTWQTVRATDSFESWPGGLATAPSGWTEADVNGTSGDWQASTNGTNHPTPGGTPPAGGGAVTARFNSWTATSGHSTRIRTSSSFSTAGYSQCRVRFQMYHDTAYSGSNDTIQVEGSTTGSTFASVGSAVSRYDGSSGWKEAIVDFSAYAGQATAYVSFLGISAYGNDQFIDLATVECLGSTPGASVFYSMTLAGGSTVTPSQDVIVNGKLTIGSGGALADNGKTVTVVGDVDNSGTHSGAGKLLLTGGTASHGLSGSGAYQNLELSDAQGALLGGSPTVNGTLTLTAGNLTLGANSLTMGPGAPAIAGGPFSAAKMIVADGGGSLCKQGADATSASYAFPIGDGAGTAEYSPAALSFTSGTFAGDAQECVSVTNSPQPNSDLTNYPTYIKRYWTVAQSGISGFSANTSFTYTDADLVAGAGQTESGMALWKYDAGLARWYMFDPVDATGNLLTGTVSSFSDFTGRSASPLAVQLAGFTAELTADGRVVLNWETVSEQDNAGFNVYRGESESGPWTKVNEELIASLAPGSSEGQAYRWTETLAAPEARYWYLLEDVNVIGAATRHGPVNVGFDVPNAVRLETFDAQSAGELIPLVLLTVGIIVLAIISRRNGGGT